MSTVQIVESRHTGTAVPLCDMRQAFTLSCYLITACLMIHCAIRGAVTWFTLVRWIRCQGTSIKAFFTSVTVETCCVVDAFQAFTRCPITVSHSIWVNVVIALAKPTAPNWAITAKRVTKVPIVTEFTALTSGASRAVRTHYFFCLGNNSTT